VGANLLNTHNKMLYNSFLDYTERGNI